MLAQLSFSCTLFMSRKPTLSHLTCPFPPTPPLLTLNHGRLGVTLTGHVSDGFEVIWNFSANSKVTIGLVWFFQSEWDWKYSQILSRGRFMIILGCRTMCENIYCWSLTFLEPITQFRSDIPTLIWAAESITSINTSFQSFSSLQKLMLESRLFSSLFSGLNIRSKRASGVC